MTKYSYDIRGNVLTKEVGILDDGSGGDLLQPEHAVYSWQYYPEGHPNEFLLATEFSPLHSGEADIYRVDFEYDAAGRLTKRLDSADEVGGDRPETTFTYDNNGRLVATIDPMGRTTTYTFDTRNRLVRTEYDDGSTAETLYGSANGDENTVVKTCLLYTSPSPRDATLSRMPSSA